MTSIIDKNECPERFPTHAHNPEFWEELGRTVATFGFLEEVLLKAFYAFTATKRYSEEEIAEALEQWVAKLERALSSTLGNLINVFEKAVKEHPGATITNLDDLTCNLRAASKIRNDLCHGSWHPPDANGASVPFYINRQNEKFETPVDLQFLRQTQAAVAELSCKVISTVTHMGLQFPGGTGPGKPIR